MIRLKSLLKESLLNELQFGTQMTTEQEIAFIKNRLQELEFTHQASFDAYTKNHKMRPDTKVTIGGKETTAGDASKKPGMLQKLGAKLFGKGEEPVAMPKLDPKNPINKVMVWDDKRGSQITIGKALENPDKYKHLAADIQSMVDVDPDGTKAQKYIDKKKQRRKDAEAERKAFNKKQADLKKWREENPELAKKKDAEDQADRDKREKDRKRQQGYDAFDYLASQGGILGKNNDPYHTDYEDLGKDDDDDDDKFKGFGGGSFGGGGASGDW
jgi:hypothetical protein